MQHIILAVITMSVVWFAWRNFKQLGRLKAAEAELPLEDRQKQQMRYVSRIIMCLVALAVLPFLFTIVTNQ